MIQYQSNMPNRTCYYCLCRVCTRVQCPRGRYHCMPCYHGQIIDCDFFQHRKVARYFKIVRHQPAIKVSQLLKLRDAINQILGDQPEAVEPVRTGSLHEQLKREEQRHKLALKQIVENANKTK